MTIKVILFLFGIYWMISGFLILGKAQCDTGKIINKFPEITDPFWSGFMTSLLFQIHGPFATKLLV